MFTLNRFNIHKHNLYYTHISKDDIIKIIFICLCIQPVNFLNMYLFLWHKFIEQINGFP